MKKKKLWNRKSELNLLKKRNDNKSLEDVLKEKIKKFKIKKAKNNEETI